MKLNGDSRLAPDPSRRRLLYVQPCSSFGGAERQASLNIPRLSDSGFDVLPLVGPSKTIVRWLNDNGVDKLVHARDFPGGWAKLRGLARVKLPFYYLRCLRQASARIEALARTQHIDVILAAMPFSWVAATPVGRKLGIPVIWRAGGTEVSPVERIILSAWSMLNPPDLLVCCGDAVHDLFAPLVRAPAVVVANGVDTDTFHPRAGDRDRHRPAGARLVVGFAARLCAQKRPEDFLHMAAEVGRRHPDVAFLVAGDGSRRSQYQAMVRASTARDQVRFLGYVDDMRSFYAACDIVVLPSRSEGCPNVVLESMAMRRALVVSNAAGTREVVGDGREGLVYPVGDIAAFAAAVRRLIDEPSLRHALETRAYDRVKASFSTRASARRLAGLLHAVMGVADLRRDAPAAIAHPGWIKRESRPSHGTFGMRGAPSPTARVRPWWQRSRSAGGGGQP